MEKIRFDQLGLSDAVMRAIEDMGFEYPSEIQAQVIPELLTGNDCIGQAQTGTGKTLAFSAPILSTVDFSGGSISGIVLTPTRELALQVSEEMGRIARYSKVRLLPVYGGSPIVQQIRALRNGVDIVVGTPGRVIDLINRKVLDITKIKFLILDEADEMLNMGFIDDIETIMASSNDQRQTLLFSATMPREIKMLSKKYMKENAGHVAVLKKSLTVSQVVQAYFEVPHRDRFEALCRILDKDRPKSAILFCNTKRRVDEVVQDLGVRGYNVEGMHGDMNQSQRLNTLKKFKEGFLELLVATDVAARGIDVENVTHVINYDLPQDAESYVHRIGRTGRANREGTAYSLVNPKEYFNLKQIEKITKSKIEKRGIPTMEDIFKSQYRDILDTVEQELSEDKYQRFLPLVEELPEGQSLNHVVAALMNSIYKQNISFDYTQENINKTNSRFVRLFITVGSMDRLTPKKLLEFFNTAVRYDKSDIGDISIMTKFTFVDVKDALAKDIIKNLSDQRLCGRKAKIEISSKRK